MQELLPVALGGIIGLVVQWIQLYRWRAVVFVVLCAVVGAFASFINGELDEGLAPLFVSADALLVWLGALITVGLATAWRRRNTVGSR